MPCIASSFRSAHKPSGSCNAVRSWERLNLIYKIARGLSCRADNVCSARNGHAAVVALCLLLGAKRKTYAHTELFRF
jgi:hypothetical protein